MVKWSLQQVYNRFNFVPLLALRVISITELSSLLSSSYDEIESASFVLSFVSFCSSALSDSERELEPLFIRKVNGIEENFASVKL